MSSSSALPLSVTDDDVALLRSMNLDVHSITADDFVRSASSGMTPAEACVFRHQLPVAALPAVDSELAHAIAASDFVPPTPDELEIMTRLGLTAASISAVDIAMAESLSLSPAMACIIRARDVQDAAPNAERDRRRSIQSRRDSQSDEDTQKALKNSELTAVTEAMRRKQEGFVEADNSYPFLPTNERIEAFVGGSGGTAGGARPPLPARPSPAAKNDN